MKLQGLFEWILKPPDRGDVRGHTLDAPCHDASIAFNSLRRGTELSGTPVHPVWSLDRNDWVPLGELVEEENLATDFGSISVSSLELYRTTEPVYNFETLGEHVYQVTQLGLLVHKAYTTGAGRNRKGAPVRTGQGPFGYPSGTTIPKPKAPVSIPRDPFKGWDAGTKVQDALKGTGQIAALQRNPNLPGVDTRALLNMTLAQVKELLTAKQWKTFMKHFENRDLRHGN